MYGVARQVALDTPINMLDNTSYSSPGEVVPGFRIAQCSSREYEHDDWRAKMASHTPTLTCTLESVQTWVGNGTMPTLYYDA